MSEGSGEQHWILLREYVKRLDLIGLMNINEEKKALGHLWYDGEPAPQPVQAQLRDIHPINEDSTTGRLYQPCIERCYYSAKAEAMFT